MRRITALLAPCALVATVAATLPAGANGARSTFVIRTSDGLVARIGAFHPRRSATLASAIRVFGRPSSIKLLSDNACRVDWRRIRLRINFASFAGHAPGETTCTPSVGFAQSFTARGSRFRTSAGLRVGAASVTVTDRYSDAEFRGGRWWLVTAVSPFGDESEYPVVSAIVGSGRVRALSGWIGGAGE